MKTKITRRQTPEEKELHKKLSELASLEAELAQHELDLATLQAELRTFENRYLRVIGVRYTELDEIEAQIAEALARLNPKDNKAKEKAEKARYQAQESSHATGNIQEQKEPLRFKPSENLKKLYRKVAKSIHPDLATDEEERARRQKLMAEANRAYEEGDEESLRAILREWESSPESVRGEGPGAELVRIIRKIAQVEERLRTIQIEITQLKESDLYKLKTKVEAAEKEGRELLADMAKQLDEQKADARKRLAEIKERAKI
ncbi:MAG: molecular chaperone DnaJ [Thermodesulfobacteriota bacterium]